MRSSPYWESIVRIAKKERDQYSQQSVRFSDGPKDHLSIRLRIVFSFGDGDSGAGEIHALARVLFVETPKLDDFPALGRVFVETPK